MRSRKPQAKPVLRVGFDQGVDANGTRRNITRSLVASDMYSKPTEAYTYLEILDILERVSQGPSRFLVEGKVHVLDIYDCKRNAIYSTDRAGRVRRQRVDTEGLFTRLLNKCANPEFPGAVVTNTGDIRATNDEEINRIACGGFMPGTVGIQALPLSRQQLQNNETLDGAPPTNPVFQIDYHINKEMQQQFACYRLGVSGTVTRRRNLPDRVLCKAKPVNDTMQEACSAIVSALELPGRRVRQLSLQFFQDANGKLFMQNSASCEVAEVEMHEDAHRAVSPSKGKSLRSNEMTYGHLDRRKKRHDAGGKRFTLNQTEDKMMANTLRPIRKLPGAHMEARANEWKRRDQAEALRLQDHLMELIRDGKLDESEYGAVKRARDATADTFFDPEPRHRKKDTMMTAALGSTQLKGCPGDFCHVNPEVFSLTHASDAHSSKAADAQKTMRELLADNVAKENERLRVQMGLRRADTGLSDVSGEKGFLVSGKIRKKNKSGDTHIGTPENAIALRTVIVARLEKHLVDLLLRRRLAGEPGDYVTERNRTLLVEEEYPSQVYEKAHVCDRCYSMYSFVEREREKAMRKLDAADLRKKFRTAQAQSIADSTSLTIRDPDEVWAEAEGLKAAQLAMASVTKADLAEIRSFTKPPPAVSMCVGALFVCLTGEALPWAKVKRVVGTESFLNTLKSFDPALMTQQRLRAVMGYVENPLFRPETVATVNQAAARLCAWVLGAVQAENWISGRAHGRTNWLEAADSASPQLSLRVSPTRDLSDRPKSSPITRRRKPGAKKKRPRPVSSNPNIPSPDRLQVGSLDTGMTEAFTDARRIAAEATRGPMTDSPTADSSLTFAQKLHKRRQRLQAERAVTGVRSRFMEPANIHAPSQMRLPLTGIGADNLPEEQVEEPAPTREELRRSRKKNNARALAQKRQMERLHGGPPDGSAPTQADSVSGRAVCADGFTSMPFEVLGQISLAAEEKSSAAGLTPGNAIFIHDIFDTFETSSLLFRPVLQKLTGCQMLLFNYPGQANTSLPPQEDTTGTTGAATNEFADVPPDSPSKLARGPPRTSSRGGSRPGSRRSPSRKAGPLVLNNEWLADRVFELLEHINKTGSMILDGRPLHVIGVGAGASIAAAFVKKYSRKGPYTSLLRSFVCLNGFVQQDAQLSAILHSTARVFASLPEDRPDLQTEYWSQFQFSDEYIDRVGKELTMNLYTAITNSITLIGRRQLIRGMLENSSLREDMQALELPVLVLQSMEDKLVNPSNVDVLITGRRASHLWTHQFRFDAQGPAEGLGYVVENDLLSVGSDPSDIPRNIGGVFGNRGAMLMGETLSQRNGTFVGWIPGGHEIRYEQKDAVLDMVRMVFGALPDLAPGKPVPQAPAASRAMLMDPGTPQLGVVIDVRASDARSMAEPEPELEPERVPEPPSPEPQSPERLSRPASRGPSPAVQQQPIVVPDPVVAPPGRSVGIAASQEPVPGMAVGPFADPNVAMAVTEGEKVDDVFAPVFDTTLGIDPQSPFLDADLSGGGKAAIAAPFSSPSGKGGREQAEAFLSELEQTTLAAAIIEDVPVAQETVRMTAVETEEAVDIGAVGPMATRADRRARSWLGFAGDPNAEGAEETKAAVSPVMTMNIAQTEQIVLGRRQEFLKEVRERREREAKATEDAIRRIALEAEERRRQYEEEDKKMLAMIDQEFQQRRLLRARVEEEKRAHFDVVDDELVASGLVDAYEGEADPVRAMQPKDYFKTAEVPEYMEAKVENILATGSSEGPLESLVGKLEAEQKAAQAMGIATLDEYEHVQEKMATAQLERATHLAVLTEEEKMAIFAQNAAIVQRVWRGVMGRIRAAKMREEKKTLGVESKMAVRIQAIARGGIARAATARIRQIEIQELVVGQSAGTIQRYYRGYRGRCRYYELMRLKMIQTIQRVWRGSRGREKARKLREALELMKRKEIASAQIQAAWRMYVAKEEYRILRAHMVSAREVQRVYRGYIGRRRASRKRRWENAEPGPERLKLGMQLIEETKLAFERQQEEIDALHRAQERAESRLSAIHTEMLESESELKVLEKELQEIDQIERDLEELTHERQVLVEGIEGAAGLPQAKRRGEKSDGETTAKRQSVEMAIHVKRAEREARRQELEAEFASVLQQVEKKRKALERLETALGDMEATRERKDREFGRLQRNLMELLQEQKHELDVLREKGIQLETATATSAAAAAATAQRAAEHEKRSESMYAQTEELMKFQFMSMSLSYFSSLNMLQQMRDINHDTTRAAVTSSASVAAAASAAAAAASIPSLKNLKLGAEDLIGASLRKKQGDLEKAKRMEEEVKDAMNLPFPEDVRLWTVEDVSRWLDTLRLSQYKRAFEDASVDGNFLIELRETDMSEVLGMEHKLHIRKVVTARAKLMPLNEEEQSKLNVVREEKSAELVRAGQAAPGEGVPKLDAVFSQARNGRIKRVEESLNLGFPIDAEDAKGNTLLMVAVQQTNQKLTAILISRGADLNHQNAAGNTALHYAMAYDPEGVMGEFLIEKGADDSLENVVGLSCYDGLGD